MPFGDTQSSFAPNHQSMGKILLGKWVEYWKGLVGIRWCVNNSFPFFFKLEKTWKTGKRKKKMKYPILAPEEKHH